MKKISIFVLFIFISFSAKANISNLGIFASIYSKKLTGTLDSTGTEGKLVSSSDLHYGLDLEYAFSPAFRFIFNYQTGNVDFDNTDNIITGEESFDINSTKLGFRWIIHPRVAFRSLLNLDKELAFDVNGSNQAEVYSESVNYLSVFYDQIVFLGTAFYSGFRLGYDIPASGDTIEDRTGNFFSVFAVIGNLEISYNYKKVTKSNNDLTFEEIDSALNFSYGLRF